MGKFNPLFMGELKKWVPDICEDQIVELGGSNLDLSEPQKKVKSITVIFEDAIRVYTDGALILEERLENVEKLQIIQGVGCVFAEYVKKGSDEHVLFARADSRYQGPMGAFVKRVNYFLRSGDRDFSRLKQAKGRICPKCGKP